MRCPRKRTHSCGRHSHEFTLKLLLPDDLEKYAQLNRARLTSYGVLREEIKIYCECRGHAIARNAKQKGASHPGEADPINIGASGKGEGKQSKGIMAKGKSKWKQGQHRRVSVGTVESADTSRKNVGARRTPTKRLETIKC